MELNWSTFILEIINFGVLLWLLRHFLYKPVLDIIESRRQKINAAVEQARADRVKAESLRDEYNDRLAQWQREREQALEKLQQEFTGQRAKQMKQLQQELDDEREKARVSLQREQQALAGSVEKTALRQGSEFAARLLTPLADATLEAALVQLFISELDNLPEAAREQVRTGAANGEAVTVSSVWPLDDARQDALRQALGKVLQEDNPAMTFTQDASLLAGLRVVAGGMVLGANLRDELKAFAGFHDNAGLVAP